MNKLQDFLDENEGTSDDGFRVENDQAANWALRKIGQLNDQIDDNNALAQSEIDKIEQWNKEVNSTINNSIDYFQSLLAQYAADKKAEDPKFKSLKLPNGNFGFRKRQPKWNYDNEKVVQALEKAEMNDLIRVKKEPAKADIKKAFAVNDGQVINPQTGEVIEGITIEEQADSFTLKVRK